MELQQYINVITQILKQTLELQHIWREDLILNIKGKQKTHFSDFGDKTIIALNQRFHNSTFVVALPIVLMLLKLNDIINLFLHDNTCIAFLAKACLLMLLQFDD